jgi:hypothetical protein
MLPWPFSTIDCRCGRTSKSNNGNFSIFTTTIKCLDWWHVICLSRVQKYLWTMVSKHCLLHPNYLSGSTKAFKNTIQTIQCENKEKYEDAPRIIFSEYLLDLSVTVTMYYKCRKIMFITKTTLKRKKLPRKTLFAEYLQMLTR